jgi:pSer/pThr/pTyr-binding forkhead associated (FHA) protein
MTGNIVHLNQLFQAINQFVSRANQYSGLVEVNQELAKIAPLFNARSLSLQVFSLFPILSEGLNNFFNAHQGLRQFYSSQISDFPVNVTVTLNDQAPTLILKGNSQIGQPEARYELSSTQSILIGRDLQYQSDAKLIHIPLSVYRKVSGRHAEIQPVTSINSASQSWQICDLNSTNGTYINSQRIKGCQVLKSGDKITLAYPSASEKSPEFIFEGQISSSTSGISTSNLIDSDLVILVTHPTQGLSTSEKQLVEQISRSLALGFIIIADVSGTKPEAASSIRENLVSIQDWIKTKYPELAKISEVTELSLSPFYPNTPPSKLSSAVEQQLVQFATPLIDLAKAQGSEPLISRISGKLQTQIQQIDQILGSHEEALKHEIQRSEAGLKGNSLDYWRDRYTSLKKQIEESRDDFFREARTGFLRNRDDFSTDFIPNNFIQKTEDFVSQLEPVVNKLNGAVCIQLRPQNGQELHATMIQFFHIELTRWGDLQWECIRCSVESDGLVGLLQKAYSQLNCLPEFQLTNTFSLPVAKLDFSAHFNTSFSEVKTDISYGESSGDTFGGIARIAMMSAQAAISIGVSVSTQQPPSPYALMQGASAVSALAGFVGASVSRSQQQKLKIEQVVDSLKRTTSNYYKNIARYLLNRVVQEIVSAIDTEDRRFRKARDTADEQIRRYFMELENISRGYRIRQEALHKDRVAFDQIKRLGG